PAASPRGPWRSSEAPRGGGSPSDIARGRGSSYAGYFYTRRTVDLQEAPAGRSKDRKRRFLDRSRLDENDEGYRDGDDKDPRDPQVTMQPTTLADQGVSIRGQTLSPKVPKGSGSPFSGERSDLHVWRYPGEGEADDVAHVRALQQLRVLDLEAHGHPCGHEARDLLVGQHHYLDLRDHRAHHAFHLPGLRRADHDRTLTFPEAALEARDLAAPGEPANEHANRQRQVEEEHDAPEPHQCTCSSGGATVAGSWLSACTSASRRLMSDHPGRGPPGIQRARR